MTRSKKLPALCPARVSASKPATKHNSKSNIKVTMSGKWNQRGSHSAIECANGLIISTIFSSASNNTPRGRITTRPPINVAFVNSPSAFIIFYFVPLRLDRRTRSLLYTRNMTIKRLDHVSVVVDDLAAAIAFFTALGMTLAGEMPVEGPWVDRVNGLEGVQVNIVMMRTPDGHGRLELTKFRNPKPVEIEPAIAPPNTLGLRSVMFTVESVDDTVARLRANGAELVGEVVQYEDKYRLCYMRGPAGLIVALAEELF